MKINHLFTLLILVIVLVSCTSQDQPALQEEGYPIEDFSAEPLNDINAGYPIEDYSAKALYDLNAGYPIEGEWSEHVEYFVSEITIPSPQEGLAVVHGTLMTLSDNLPYLAPSLYLGQIIKPEDDAESTFFLSSLSIEDDPVAVQSVDGDFVFIDITPGEYGLFIWTPMSLFLIEDTKTDNPVIFNVKAGETYDLGTIYIP